MKKWTLQIVAIAWLLLLQGALNGAKPAWWSDYAIVANLPSDDGAVANLGQLKYLYYNASQYLNETLADVEGLDDPILEVIEASSFWDHADNDRAVTIGEAKTWVGLIYDQLNSEEVQYDTTEFHLSPGYYPWGDDASADDQLILLGQLKSIFRFDLSDWIAPGKEPEPEHDEAFRFAPWIRDAVQRMVDADPNDDWETLYDFEPGGDADGDGVKDVREMLEGMDPLNPDTDGDGYDDAVEFYQHGYPTDPDKWLPKYTYAFYFDHEDKVIYGLPRWIDSTVNRWGIDPGYPDGHEVSRTVRFTCQTGFFLHGPKGETNYGTEVTIEVNEDGSRWPIYYVYPEGLYTPDHIRIAYEDFVWEWKTLVVKPEEAPANAPYSIRYSQIGGLKKLVWEDRAENETGYIIQRQGSDGEWYKVGEVGADVTEFVIEEAEQ